MNILGASMRERKTAMEHSPETKERINFVIDSLWELAPYIKIIDGATSAHFGKLVEHLCKLKGITHTETDSFFYRGL